MVANETMDAVRQDAPAFDPGSAATSASRYPVVVGTEARPDASGAVRVGHLLARRDGARLHVIGVLDALPPAGTGASRQANATESVRVADLRRRIEQQLRELGVPADERTIEIVIGRPDAALSDVAKREQSDLLLVGMGSHGVLGRLLGVSTALGAARYAHVPVLAVDPRAKALPRIAIVGTDFGEASLAAARAVVECLSPTGTIHLVYVRPVISRIGPGALSVDIAYETELVDRLRSLGAALRVPPGLRVVRHVLAGPPAQRLVELAERESADLIAVGAHGNGRLAAFMVGSTASRVLGAGQTSVLVARGYAPAGKEQIHGATHTTTSRLPLDWPQLLTDFTQRNAERRTLLEIDDPAIGAQSAEHGYPLRGIAYDPRGHQVEIMLGDLKGTQHMTHMMTAPEEIAIVSTATGRDLALRIATDGRTAILSFLNGSRAAADGGDRRHREGT